MIQLHIRLPEDVVESIENIMEGDNTTDKVKNFICSNIIGRDNLLMEKDKLNLRLKHIEKSLAENPFYAENKLSGPESNFLNETLETMKNNPQQFKGSPSFIIARKNSYNEKFLKSITSKEFELLLYKFKERLEKEI